MVSAVICLPLYDRITCLLFSFFALGVHQVNIRAYYKVLYQVAPDATNDSLYWLGMASCLSLPLIGVFDEHDYKIVHGICAGIYFICMLIYSWNFARTLVKHKAVYPKED